MKVKPFIAAMLLCLPAAFAAPGTNFSDECYSGTWSSSGDFTVDLKITNSCESGSYLQYTEDLNLTQFGDVVDDEVIIGSDYMFVDTSIRPDLNGTAELHFIRHDFAVEPNVLRDGEDCSSCNITYGTREVVVEVPGFSNYSLTYKQEFSVFSDDDPELKSKVYQTVDLGNSYRNKEFSCVVQIYGRSNDDGSWVLVQTNPERDAVGNFLGDPDTNQPESKGYFDTTNGVTNVYFRGGFLDKIAGYHKFQYVAKCANNQSSLVFEEPITTTYTPLGRQAQGRAIWLMQSGNASYLVFYIIGGIFTLWFLGALFVSIKRSFGY